MLPVILPGVWGYVEGEEFSPKHPIGGYIQYTVGLNFGSITLQSLSIGGCGLPINGSLSLRADEVVRWDCSLWWSSDVMRSCYDTDVCALYYVSFDMYSIPCRLSYVHYTVCVPCRL